MNQDIWDQTQMLEIFNQELKVRESLLSTAPVGKNFEFDSEYTGSDDYNIVTYLIARKEFLKNNNLCFPCLKRGHLSRNCKRSKTCFYCKRCHNSAILHKVFLLCCYKPLT